MFMSGVDETPGDRFWGRIVRFWGRIAKFWF